jgi:hypothetical protein
VKITRDESGIQLMAGSNWSGIAGSPREGPSYLSSTIKLETLPVKSRKIDMSLKRKTISFKLLF